MDAWRGQGASIYKGGADPSGVSASNASRRRIITDAMVAANALNRT